MNVDYSCGNFPGARDALIAYLYDDCGVEERVAIDAHVIGCARCAAEVSALRAARASLASWVPPDVSLGFQIVGPGIAAGTPSNVLRPSRWWQRPLPAWGQAAAAVVIFAAGAMLGMRTGDPAPSPEVAAAPAVASQVSARELAALEQRLRREMTQLRAAEARIEPSPETAPRAVAARSDEQVLQRVRELLADSERRQQREVALRLSQVLRDIDVQRRLDLARIEETFGQMEGMTGAELQQQRQAINYLRRVAQRPQ